MKANDKYIITAPDRWKILPAGIESLYIFYQYTTGKTLFVGETKDLKDELYTYWNMFGDNFRRKCVQVIAFPLFFRRGNRIVDLQKLASEPGN